MKTVTVNYTLPTKREKGGDLAIEDIAGVEVAISADNGMNWSVMPLVPPTETSTQIFDVDTGDYIARGVVIDKVGDGQRSTPLTASFIIQDESAPMALSAISVTLT